MHFSVTAYDIICVLHCAYLGNILNWNNTEWKHFPVDVQLWCHSQSLSAGQINDFVHLHFSKRNNTGKEKKKCSWKVLKEVADTLIFILTCDFTRMNNWFLELHYKLWEWRVFKCRQLMLYSQKRRGRGVFVFFSFLNQTSEKIQNHFFQMLCLLIKVQRCFWLTFLFQDVCSGWGGDQHPDRSSAGSLISAVVLWTSASRLTDEDVFLILSELSLEISEAL